MSSLRTRASLASCELVWLLFSQLPLVDDLRTPARPGELREPPGFRLPSFDERREWVRGTGLGGRGAVNDEGLIRQDGLTLGSNAATVVLVLFGVRGSTSQQLSLPMPRREPIKAFRYL